MAAARAGKAAKAAERKDSRSPITRRKRKGRVATVNVIDGVDYVACNFTISREMHNRMRDAADDNGRDINNWCRRVFTLALRDSRPMDVAERLDALTEEIRKVLDER
jgi:hypothetical protein